jgi:hypothetical protein
MNKLKQYFSLAMVFWGAANLSQSSRAQYWVPIQPPIPSHDIMFPGVRERSVDQNKGSAPAPRFRSPNPSDTYSPTKRFDTNSPTPNRPQNQSYPSNSLNTGYAQIIAFPPSLDKFCAQFNGNPVNVKTKGVGNAMEIEIISPGAGTLVYRTSGQQDLMSVAKSLCGS